MLFESHLATNLLLGGYRGSESKGSLLDMSGLSFPALRRMTLGIVGQVDISDPECGNLYQNLVTNTKYFEKATVI